MLYDGRMRYVLCCTVLAAFATSGCSSPVESIHSDIAEVIVSPHAVTVQVGRKEQLDARVLDARGEEQNGRQVFWAVEDESIARVNSDGEVEGRKTGVTRVAASVEGVHGMATVTVVRRRAKSVSVSPSSAQLYVGNSMQLHASAIDNWDDEIANHSFTWQSSNTKRAVVSSTGLVTGVTPGQVTITARADDRSASSNITVLRLVRVASVKVRPSDPTVRLGQTRQLTARVRDQDGKELSGREVTWSSEDNRIATVNGSGLVTGQRVGRVKVSAVSEGVSGSTRVRVRRG